MENQTFAVSQIDTNYSDIPTGIIEANFEDWCDEHLIEVVDLNETGAIVRSEWGNGEGYDTFKVEFDI